MSDERTLGDILGAALAGSALDALDPPSYDEDLQRVERVDDALASYAGATDAAIAGRAQYEAACELSREVASLLRVTEAEVFERLTYVPDEMLPLLQTPEGWSALAAHVAADLGVLTVSYSPSRH